MTETTHMHFPVFLDLSGKSCLVVGGGEEAARKAEMLRRAGARVVATGRFDPRDLDDCTLAIVAGVERASAETISRMAMARGVLVNVVDEPRLCSFIMPAVVDRAPVTLAISTGGNSPLLARLLRQALDRALPKRLGELAELVGNFRPQVKKRLPTFASRKRFWEKVLAGTVAALALAGKRDAAQRALGEALDEAVRESNSRDAA